MNCVRSFTAGMFAVVVVLGLAGCDDAPEKATGQSPGTVLEEKFAWRHVGKQWEDEFFLIPMDLGDGTSLRMVDGVAEVSRNGVTVKERLSPAGEGWPTEVDAAAGNDIWAVVESGLRRWDGREWHAITAPDEPRDLAAVSPDEIWTLSDALTVPGKNIKAVVRHWSEGEWSEVAADEKLLDIDAHAAHGLWAVTEDKVLHYADGRWTDQSPKNDIRLTAIAVTADGRVWAGTDSDRLLVRESGAWSETRLPTPEQNPILEGLPADFALKPDWKIERITSFPRSLEVVAAWTDDLDDQDTVRKAYGWDGFRLNFG
ncbi:hypothetical protein ABGB12_16425 [Actinocorallia sp. B10E7]|uniref:hypothetical protein n=1 Tax=Actinocorallia sp. B10E7 TaxID=3153558 RepID=UPI00325E73F0